MRGSSQVKLLLAQLVQVLLLVLKLKPAGLTVQMLRGRLLVTRAIRCECASTPLCLHKHKGQRIRQYTPMLHQNHAILLTRSCRLHATNHEQAQKTHVESPPPTAQQYFENLTKGVKFQSAASMNRPCSTSCQSLPCVSQPAAKQSCTCSWQSAAGEIFSSYCNYRQCSCKWQCR